MAQRNAPTPHEFHLHPGKKTAMAGTGVVVGAILGGPVAALIGGALGTAFGAAAEAKQLKQSKSEPTSTKAVETPRPRRAHKKRVARKSRRRRRAA